jgi:hypothetical protein
MYIEQDAEMVLVDLVRLGEKRGMQRKNGD